MANTPRTRAVEASMASAQALNPRNIDDAYWMLAHPSGISADDLRIARETYERSIVY